mmetsp:Transcript_20727/g.57598  ORF Transcript_20727/g.57598 Transcript_20727/m.57598 type:complete len:95 (+) Transcript_20727:253-537(+)
MRKLQQSNKHNNHVPPPRLHTNTHTNIYTSQWLNQLLSLVSPRTESRRHSLPSFLIHQHVHVKPASPQHVDTHASLHNNSRRLKALRQDRSLPP